MSDAPNPIELTAELAEIARTTADPETGRQLMVLVHRLLTGAGLPLGDDGGGGELPASWLSDPVCDPA